MKFDRYDHKLILKRVPKYRKQQDFDLQDGLHAQPPKIELEGKL